MTSLYFAQKIQLDVIMKFNDDQEPASSHEERVPLKFLPGMVGAIPVFESREAAVKFGGPGAQIKEMEIHHEGTKQ